MTTTMLTPGIGIRRFTDGDNGSGKMPLDEHKCMILRQILAHHLGSQNVVFDEVGLEVAHTFGFHSEPVEDLLAAMSNHPRHSFCPGVGVPFRMLFALKLKTNDDKSDTRRPYIVPVGGLFGGSLQATGVSSSSRLWVMRPAWIGEGVRMPKPPQMPGILQGSRLPTHTGWSLPITDDATPGWHDLLAKLKKGDTAANVKWVTFGVHRPRQ